MHRGKIIMEDYDLMTKVEICHECGRNEYYGHLHWVNGHEICRKCVYERWKEINPDWEPNEDDKTYPSY